MSSFLRLSHHTANRACGLYGKAYAEIGGTYLQAESEIAAVNMVLGAAAAGVRAMTSSSSPGISLKGEGISYMAGSDLPALIINVQRGGPGLGGIQPSQSDYWQATKALGHGDFQILVFAPSTVQEMVDLVSDAFDKADEYRMPAMILADGMLGQMMEPVELREHKDRKTSRKPWAACGHEKIKESTTSSTPLYLTPNALEDLVRARYERYKIVERKEQRAEEYRTEDADVIVVAYGASSRVARSAVNKAREARQEGRFNSSHHAVAVPEDAIKRAADHAKELLVVEMSMGQMVDDVRLAARSAACGHSTAVPGGDSRYRRKFWARSINFLK